MALLVLFGPTAATTATPRPSLALSVPAARSFRWRFSGSGNLDETDLLVLCQPLRHIRDQLVGLGFALQK